MTGKGAFFFVLAGLTAIAVRVPETTPMDRYTDAVLVVLALWSIGVAVKESK